MENLWKKVKKDYKGQEDFNEKDMLHINSCGAYGGITGQGDQDKEIMWKTKFGALSEHSVTGHPG